MFTKILVGIDGSEPANHALLYAIEEANKWGAEIVVLTVTPKVNTTFYLGDFDAIDYDVWEDELESVHKGILMKVEDKLKGYPDLKFKTILKKGKASKHILETAKEENSDLIVIGSRGIGGLSGYLLGSTSKHVVDHCQIPVLIVK